MSNQTHTKIEDPEINRRRYLEQQRQKYFAWFAGIVALLCFIVCGATTIVLARNIIAPETPDTVHSRSFYPVEREDVPWPVLVSIIAITGFITLRMGIWANERAVDLEDVPYVPSVAEQIAALPAEEVLLRGSDQPATLRQELLRAAQAGKTEAADELLRVSGMPTEGRS